VTKASPSYLSRYCLESTSLYKSKFHPVTRHEGPEREQRYSSSPSLTLTLDGDGWSSHAPDALPPVKRSSTNCTGSWVGPWAILDGCNKSRSTRIWPLYNPAGSKLLYRLSYPATPYLLTVFLQVLCNSLLTNPDLLNAKLMWQLCHTIMFKLPCSAAVPLKHHVNGQDLRGPAT